MIADIVPLVYVNAHLELGMLDLQGVGINLFVAGDLQNAEHHDVLLVTLRPENCRRKDNAKNIIFRFRLKYTLELQA